MKCYHHHDLDGRCTAAIVYRHGDKKKQGIELIEVDYKDEIDVNAIKKDEEIYIVDFSFKPEVMKRVLEKTSLVVWIDHHVTAKEYDYGVKLLGLREFEEKKFAGCHLTWQYFHPGAPMPKAVDLIGDRDCWRWSFGKVTKHFCSGMALLEQDPKHDNWDKLFNDEKYIDLVLENGIIIEKFRTMYYRDYMKSYGYAKDWEGHRCCFVNLPRIGSMGFGVNFEKYDVCVSYVHDGKKYAVSLYSKKVDVSEIVKKYGGGGHKGAAGFVCNELPFK